MARLRENLSFKYVLKYRQGWVLTDTSIHVIEISGLRPSNIKPETTIPWKEPHQ